jgi:autotransporter adhesin
VGNERKIVNVAAGTLTAGSTDAVNGGQLLTANQRVAAAFGGGAGLDVNGQLTAPSYTIQGTVYNDVGSAFTAVNTQLSAMGSGSNYYKANSTGPRPRPRAPTHLPLARMRKGAVPTPSPSAPMPRRRNPARSRWA